MTHISFNKTVFVLNGPPRSGKDTAAKVIRESIDDSDLFFFIRPLKEFVHAELGLHVPYDAFEEVKDMPLALFGGVSPRQAYIRREAELISKFGPDVMINMFWKWVDSCAAPVLISTVGNNREAVAFAERFGVENLLVIRTYRDGKDFAIDSRSYVNDPKLNCVDIVNREGRQPEFEEQIKRVVTDFARSKRCTHEYMGNSSALPNLHI